MENTLFTELCKPDHLHRAWRQVRDKGAGGGIDRMTVAEFEQGADGRLVALGAELKAGEYIPEPYQEVKIAKKGSGQRILGLATVRDKIVQQAVRELIEPLLEHHFVNASYAYRKGKSTYKAIQRIKHIIQAEKRPWVLRCDIDNYFDNIDHSILLSSLKAEIQDEKILELIRLWIGMARVKKDLSWQPVKKGIPQGNILSPLLANWYLHPFDCYILEQQLGYVRYADDFVILSQQAPQARNALSDFQGYLQKQLRLQIHQGTEVRHAKRGFEYLGVFFRGAETSITPARLKALRQAVGEGLHWTAEGYDPDFVAKLRTMQFYYGRLIPNEQLEQLDQALSDALISYFRTLLHKRLLKYGQLNPELFRPLRFFSPSWQDAWRKKQQLMLKEIRKKPAASSQNPQERVDHKIQQKKKEYLKKAAEAKELLITTPGVLVGKSYGKIVIKQQGKKLAEAPWTELDNLTIMSKGVTLSSDALYQCAKNDVAVHLLDQRGRPFVQIMEPQGLSAEVGLAQLRAYENGKGIYLARAFVNGRIRNQANLVKYFRKYDKLREDTAPAAGTLSELDKVLQEVQSRKGKELERMRGQLMAAEGRAAAAYWKYVTELLAPHLDFPGRRRQGATDPVNSALNYGYAILYARVWEAVTRARLHPGLSYLHAPDQGRKPSLIFDLIEEFRVQAVDRTVLAHIRKTGSPPQIVNNLLDDDSRKWIARKVIQRLGRIEHFRGRNMRLQDIILTQARNMANFLLERDSKYSPYKGRW